MGARITVGVSDRDLIDLVITAVEGGYTTAWAELKDRSYSPSRGIVTLRERGDGDVLGQWLRITPSVIARGLKRAARAADDEGGWAFAAWLKDRIGDAIIADVILQFGVLGEARYG